MPKRQKVQNQKNPISPKCPKDKQILTNITKTNQDQPWMPFNMFASFFKKILILIQIVFQAMAWTPWFLFFFIHMLGPVFLRAQRETESTIDHCPAINMGAVSSSNMFWSFSILQ